MAYADPPYPGCGHLYKAWGGTEVNHPLLIRHLMDEFPDGWALSTSSSALQYVLSLCPEGVRVAAWVKPFASFKPGVNPAYAWEPVIFWGGRKYDRREPTVRDWLSANITLQKGLPGAKPPQFAYWVFQLLNLLPCDEFVDVFPGTGAMTTAWDEWCQYQRTLVPNA
jgi:hypothetical protein